VILCGAESHSSLEASMKAPNIKGMSFEAMVDLRDSINAQIAKATSGRRAKIERQLALLEGLNGRATPMKRAKSSLKGRSVAPKYRNPKNPEETWAGRGATPLWLRALLKKGKKLGAFAIDKSTQPKSTPKRRVKTKMMAKVKRKVKVRKAQKAQPATPAPEAVVSE